MGLCRYFIDLGFKSAVWWAIILLMKDAEILISEAFEGGGSFCGAAAFLSSWVRLVRHDWHDSDVYSLSTFWVAGSSFHTFCFPYLKLEDVFHSRSISSCSGLPGIDCLNKAPSCWGGYTLWGGTGDISMIFEEHLLQYIGNEINEEGFFLPNQNNIVSFCRGYRLPGIDGPILTWQM